MFSFRDWYSYLLLCLLLLNRTYALTKRVAYSAPYTLWTLMYAELLLDCNRATIGSILH